MRSIALSLVCLIGLAAGAHAETLRSSDGRKIGSISHEGNREVFRDANGAAKSYSTQEGNRTVFRNMDSKMLGYSQHH